MPPLPLTIRQQWVNIWPGPSKITQAPGAMRTTTVHLNSEELAALIDREARHRLNMSGPQFKAHWRRGALRNRTAAMEIAMLLRLEE